MVLISAEDQRTEGSYQLKTNGRKAGKVRVACVMTQDAGLTVSIEGKNAAQVSKKDEGGKQIVEFAVPEDLQAKDVLTVKFASGEKNVTPRVYEVRLMVVEEKK